MRKFFTEYLLLNLFIFGCIALLSLAVLNFSFFDPFTQAFSDFTLTDLYYSKVKDRHQIYKGPIVLVNIENRTRKELAYFFEHIQEANPKVVGLDMIFSKRVNEQDSILKKVFANHQNFVFGYYADFENSSNTVYTDSFFTLPGRNGYTNIVSENIEYSTIRHYYPVYEHKEAFTTGIIKSYNQKVFNKLLKRKNKKTEIHFFGNLQNFLYYNFDEVINPSFDTHVFKNKIVLAGYFGLPAANKGNKTDEDKFFTPLNDRLSGRSFPDMYGCVIHANILRMILEDDFVKVMPRFAVMFISFVLTWLILPLMCRLFFKGDLWFNPIGTIIQLTGSIVAVLITVLVYRFLNVKFDPGLFIACLVLLPTFINLYEAFLKLVRYKLKIPIRSAFLLKPDDD
jgi:CHASE2 domain-containing sensor protein